MCLVFFFFDWKVVLTLFFYLISLIRYEPFWLCIQIVLIGFLWFTMMLVSSFGKKQKDNKILLQNIFICMCSKHITCPEMEECGR